MRVTEITAKQFIKSLKDPSADRRRVIMNAVRKVLAPTGYQIKTVKIKKNGEIYFTVPGVVDEGTYGTLCNAFEQNLPSGAELMSGYWLDRDMSTPLGHASFFIEPNMPSEQE